MKNWTIYQLEGSYKQRNFDLAIFWYIMFTKAGFKAGGRASTTKGPPQKTVKIIIGNIKNTF